MVNNTYTSIKIVYSYRIIVFEESYAVSPDRKKGVSCLVSGVKTLIFLEHFTQTLSHMYVYVLKCVGIFTRVA
jgi:hypothetical protein